MSAMNEAGVAGDGRQFVTLGVYFSLTELTTPRDDRPTCRSEIF